MKRKRKKSGSAIRAVLTLFFWVFICCGAVLSILVARHAILYGGSENWPTVTGVVTASEVTRHYVPPQDFGYEARRTFGGYFYQASIEYEYTIDGRVYYGTRIGIGSKGDPHRLVERFSKGKVVSVYYDHSRPERALLLPGVDMDVIRFKLGMIAILPVAGVIGLWWTSRTR